METKKIYTAIVEIMDDIKSIGKDRYNKMQSYSFRGIDDVYNALQPALIKHKVFCVPTVKSVKREDGVSAKGTPLKYTVVDVDYEFTSAEDGSSIKISMSGEAMDSGDKSLNKALSAAYKYACFQLFCIPTESESHDSEEDTYEYHQKVDAGRRVIAVIEIQILSVFRRADRGAVLGNCYGSGLYFGSARILDAERRAVFVVRAGAEAHLYLSAQRRILVVDQRDIKIGNRFLHLHQRNVKNCSAHVLCDFPFQIRMGFHKQIDFTVQTACARMNGFAVCRSCRADFRRCRKVAARLHAQFSLDNVLQKFNAQRDFRANLHLKFRFSANVIYVEGL